MRTLFRVDPNPGYRDGFELVFDGEAGEAMLVGGDWYDADWRPQVDSGDIWTYRHGDDG